MEVVIVGSRLIDSLERHLCDVLAIQMNPDPISNLEKHQIIAADFDYYFYKEPHIVDTLRDKARLNAHYLPEGFNPRMHQKPPVKKAVAEWLTDVDILVVGKLNAYLRPRVNSVFHHHYTEISFVNQNYFEINGIGAFQLDDYKATIDDVIDEIRYYLVRPGRRHAIALQQYTHFQQHHTFNQRITQLLQTISLAPLLDSEQVQLDDRWDD